MLRRLNLILQVGIIPVLLACAAVSFAQEKDDNSIFKYKKELSITDDQEANLRTILAKLQNCLTEKTRELNVLRAELNKMLAERADLYKIKGKLRAIAQTQADASYEDIASARDIEKELTETQLSRWRNIQEEIRKNLRQAQAAAAKATDIRKEQ